MSLSVEGQQCPVCHAYLFDEDDVVHCPVCGAPHHRECYKALGHCALEHLHGTENQYKKPEAAESQKAEQEEIKTGADFMVCRSCGEEIPSDSKFCPHCRAQVTFINTEEELGITSDSQVEGVSAKEVARFTMLNPIRYVSKFFSLTKENRKSWNWAAFLMPVQWSFFRKNFKSGVLMGMLQLASAMLMIPFSVSLEQFDIANSSYSEIATLVMQNIDKIGYLPILLSFLGAAIYIGVCIFSGLNSDYIYRCRAFSEIRAAAEMDDDDKAEHYRKKGGVNLFFFVIAHFAIVYLPSVLISLATVLF